MQKNKSKKIFTLSSFKKQIAFVMAMIFILNIAPSRDSFGQIQIARFDSPRVVDIASLSNGSTVSTLDENGYVYTSGSFPSGSGSGDFGPLRRVTKFDLPIRDIINGRFVFLAISQDSKFFYTYGFAYPSIYNGNGLTTTYLGDNVYKYDFFSKYGTYVVDMAIKHESVFLVDSAGDLYVLGQNSDNRGGSNGAINKLTPTSATTPITGKFVSVSSSEYNGSANAPANYMAITDAGEIVRWGQNYTSTPTKIARGEISDSEKIVQAKATNAGFLIRTDIGALYYFGKIVNESSNESGSGVAGAVNSKVIDNPIRLTKGYDYNKNEIDLTAISFIDADVQNNTLVALTSDNRVFAAGDNSANSYNASPSGAGSTGTSRFLVETRPTYTGNPVGIDSATEAQRIEYYPNNKNSNPEFDPIVKVYGQWHKIYYITASGKAYNSGNGHDTYLQAYNNTETRGHLHFSVTTPLIDAVAETGSVSKTVSGSSVADGTKRLYNGASYDAPTVNPVNKLKVTAAGVQTVNVTDSIRTEPKGTVSATTAMKYMIIYPSTAAVYNGENVYKLAQDSLDPERTPIYMGSKLVASEIHPDTYESIYNLSSIVNKGTMTKSGNEYTMNESINANGIVLFKATDNVQNGNVLAYAVDNIYKQTKAYYSGQGTTPYFSGILGLFSNAIVPGNYGVFVDENNNPILDTNGVSNPPNGFDTTADLSTYAGGKFLVDTNLNPKLAFWSAVAGTNKGQAGQTLELNTQNNSYAQLSGATQNEFNSLVYDYEKNDAKWKDAKVYYVVAGTGNNIEDYAEAPMEAIFDQSEENVLPSAVNGAVVSNFWPDTTGKYSKGGDVFTPPVILDGAGEPGENLTLIGYKIGSRPTDGMYDYTADLFNYDVTTSTFSFNPEIPQEANEEGNAIYFVYKANVDSLYERYLNVDDYVKNNPQNWTTGITNADGIAINKVDGKSTGFDKYYESTVDIVNPGFTAEIQMPYTSIENQILIGYIDADGNVVSFWNPTDKNYKKIPETIQQEMGGDKTITLLYLSDKDKSGIPDVQEGYYEENWIAVTANGTKVVMNSIINNGYIFDNFTSAESNFAALENWMYYQTAMTSGGPYGTVKETNTQQSTTGLKYHPVKPIYSNGKYNYESDFQSINYYYHEDSNVNKVADKDELIKITIKGIDDSGKELYSWPRQSSFSEESFNIKAMDIPSYATYADPEYRVSGGTPLTVDDFSNVTIDPSQIVADSNGDNHIVVTFKYKSTVVNVKIEQYLVGETTPMASYSASADYSKGYMTTVPSLSGYTFDPVNTTGFDPDYVVPEGESPAEIPEGMPTYDYSSGKLFQQVIKTDGTTVIKLYYVKNNGNINIHAVDVTNPGIVMLIGSTNSRKIGNGDVYDPSATGADPQVLEIPQLGNYSLESSKAPSFDSLGVEEATSQTYDGTTPLRDVYFFYTRDTAQVLAIAVDENGNELKEDNGLAIADSYDGEVGTTVFVTPPSSKNLRGYILEGILLDDGTVQSIYNQSVYVASETQKTNIKFVYRKLKDYQINVIAFIDKSGTGEYEQGDVILSDSYVSAIEGDYTVVTAPTYTSYDFVSSKAYLGEDTVLEELSTKNEFMFLGQDNITVYFGYKENNHTVTFNLLDENGVAIDTTLNPASHTTAKALNGLDYIAYAPHVQNYILTSSPSYEILSSVTKDEAVTFSYKNIYQVAEDHMAVVTVKGVNDDDESELYKFNVYAGMGQDDDGNDKKFSFKAVNLPTYTVDENEKEIVIGNNKTGEIEFRYTTMSEEVRSYYLDDTGSNLAPFRALDNTVTGGFATDTAIPIDGYAYIGYSIGDKDGTINPEIVAKINKVGTDNNADNQNRIYFHYKPIIGDNIIITAYEGETAGDDINLLKVLKVATDNVATTADANTNINAFDLSGSGYTLLTSPSNVTVTYEVGTATYYVNFIYKKLYQDVTIIAEDRSGKELDRFVTNERVAESYLAEPLYIGGYQTFDPAKTIIVDAIPSNNVITFVYDRLPNGNVTVKAVDENDPTNILSSYTLVGTDKERLFVNPIEIIGWKLSDSETESTKLAVIDKDADVEIVFAYQPDLVQVKIVLEDTFGNNITAKYPGQTIFDVPAVNSVLNNKINYTVYAPAVKDHVLFVEPTLSQDAKDALYSHTFTDSGTHTFVYIPIEEIAEMYMTTVTVRGINSVDNSELYKYNLTVTKNRDIEVKSLELENFSITGYEHYEVDSVSNIVQGTGSTALNVPTGNIGNTVTFIYSTILADVNIVMWNTTSGSAIGTSITTKDAVINQPYSYNAPNPDDDGFIYRYVGYTVGENSHGDTPIKSTIGKIDSINPATGAPNVIIYHYEKVNDNVYLRFVELDESGNERLIKVEPYRNITEDTMVHANDLFGGDSVQIKDALAGDYYHFVSDNPAYPVGTNVIYSISGVVQDVTFLFEKDKRDVTVNLYSTEDPAPGGEIVGTYVVEGLRVGEISKFSPKAPQDYNFSAEVKSVLIKPESEVQTVDFNLVPKDRVTVKIHLIGRDAKKDPLHTYELTGVENQIINYKLTDLVGWKLDESHYGRTLDVILREGAEYFVYYDEDVWTLKIGAVAEGVDITPKTIQTEFIVANTNSDIDHKINYTVSAPTIKGYVLKSSNTHTFNDSNKGVTHNFEYVTMEEEMWNYMVNVKIVGKGDDGRELYSYTESYPQFTKNVVIRPTVSVHENYVFNYIDAPISFAQDIADEMKVTIDIPGNGNDFTLTYNYRKTIPNIGLIRIKSVYDSSARNNNVLATSFIEGYNGTVMFVTAPEITGYTLLGSNPRKTITVGGKSGASPVEEVVYKYQKNAPVYGEQAVVKYVDEKGTLLDTDVFRQVEVDKVYNYRVPSIHLKDKTRYSFVTSSVPVNSDNVIGLTAGNTVTLTYKNIGEITVTVVEKETVVVNNDVVVTVTDTDVVTIENEVIRDVIVEVPYEVRIEPIDTGMLYVGTNNRIDYISGYSDNTVHPDASVTRAEVASMFTKLSTSKDKNEYHRNQFDDIKDSDWYAQPVNFLASVGIIGGYGNGEFRPNNYITRAEFAAIASRYDEVLQKGNANFPDVKEEHWAAAAVSHAESKGWISGYPTGLFVPEGQITRAEAVRIINAMIGRADNKIYTQSDNPYTDLTTSHWAFHEIIEASRGNVISNR